ncbi:homeobox domain-containing protein 5 [Vairimorpha necatrix]|uniref:Homeobox domain-containing protein 5 n=1 Tax=Vairimorpha necatrix TaxID=6039 RepID=A0AAX4J9K7_9MICR
MAIIMRKQLYSEAIIGLLKLKKEDKRPPNRNKKTRVQNYVLRAIFNRVKYPTTDVKSDIGVLLNLSLKSINVWFQNERQTVKCDKSDRNRSADISSQTILELYYRAIEIYS